MTPVTIFIRTYLGISATFIYRQLKGVEPDFQPSVICQKYENLEIFPHNKIHCVPDTPKYKDSPWEKLTGKIKRTISGYHNLPGKETYNFWKESLEKDKSQLIHAHFGMEGIMMLPLVEMTGVPLIVTLHGYDMSRLLRRRGYKENLREMFNKCSLVIAVSDKFKKDAISLGCPSNKVIRHYIGVPVDEFKFTKRNKAPGDPLNFLQVARFTEKKGHTTTLKTFRKVLDNGVNGKLILVGDGPLLNQCKILAKELNLGENIEFTGKKPMKEISRYLEKADIFIQHSIVSQDGDTEGIPIGIMEAMASGLPVLSTRHSGIPELVIEGKSGFLCDEKDINQYANNWVNLANDNNLRIEMGRFNRNRVEETFNIDRQNEKLKEIYKKVVKI